MCNFVLRKFLKSYYTYGYCVLHINLVCKNIFTHGCDTFYAKNEIFFQLRHRTPKSFKHKKASHTTQKMSTYTITLTPELLKKLTKSLYKNSDDERDIRKAFDGFVKKHASALKRKVPKTKKPEDFPKGAKTAYMLYGDSRRKELKEENPVLKMGGISKLLGGEWKKLRTSKKKPFIKEAAKDKARYQKELKRYKRKLEKEGRLNEIYAFLPVTELKAICKEEGLKNYTKLKKAELVELLQKGGNADDSDDSEEEQRSKKSRNKSKSAPPAKKNRRNSSKKQPESSEEDSSSSSDSEDSDEDSEEEKKSGKKQPEKKSSKKQPESSEEDSSSSSSSSDSEDSEEEEKKSAKKQPAKKSKKSAKKQPAKKSDDSDDSDDSE